MEDLSASVLAKLKNKGKVTGISDLYFGEHLDFWRNGSIMFKYRYIGGLSMQAGNLMEKPAAEVPGIMTPQKCSADMRKGGEGSFVAEN